MYNTGTPIMDALNEEFGDVPFTLTITTDAVPEDRTDWFTQDNGKLPLLGGFSSSFPEEWLDWSSHSDGKPVASGLPTEVQEYVAETLVSMDEFIAEQEKDEHGQVMLPMPTFGDDMSQIIKTLRNRSVVVIPDAEPIMLGKPIILTLGRRAALLKLAQADGQPWTSDQDASGWTDHMAEMMYGADLDSDNFYAVMEHNDRQMRLGGHTPPVPVPERPQAEPDPAPEAVAAEPWDDTRAWIKTIETATPEVMTTILDGMSDEELDKFWKAIDKFGVVVPGMPKPELKVVKPSLPKLPKPAAKKAPAKKAAAKKK